MTNTRASQTEALHAQPARSRSPLPVLMMAVFAVVLDFFVVNVALPSVQADLHASGAATEWIVAGYGLAFAVLIITGGRLGDRLGRRRRQPWRPFGGRVAMREIPAAELAVAVHRGPFAELDQTYAELGKYVTAREIGVDSPIREYYVVSYFDTPHESLHVTEVCWSVFHTGMPSRLRTDRHILVSCGLDQPRRSARANLWRTCRKRGVN